MVCANVILIPERPFDIDQVCEQVKNRFEINYAPIVVVAEGAVPKEGQMVVKDQSLDEFGHVRLSGIGEWLAQEISERTGKDARTTVLGHIQRGGTPSAYDRWLATRFGLHAIDAVKDGAFGVHDVAGGGHGRLLRASLPRGESPWSPAHPGRYSSRPV